MELHFNSSSEQALASAEILILPVYEKEAHSTCFEKLNEDLKDTLKNAASIGHFTGKKGEICSILAPVHPSIKRIILMGVGKEDDVLSLEEIGGKLGESLRNYKAKNITFCTLCLKNDDISFSAAEKGTHVAYGLFLKNYIFDHYHTPHHSDYHPKIALENVTLIIKENEEKATLLWKDLKAIGQGVFFARDLTTQPPNVLYPESYANICKKELEALGVKVTILDKKEMQDLGMNALLGVSLGSGFEPRLVVMEWKGDTEQTEKGPLAFVGKGITFDSGGISLKSSNGMEEMKYDMAGSAAVVGLFKSLALRKAKIHAVGVIPLVENMPGTHAQRPSDIVTSLSGQTIEVLNTDAEGRLVLCDALTYCQQQYKPSLIVDLATLTGAIVVALGIEHAGLFSNNDILSEQLTEAGALAGEKLWRFPLSKTYDKMIDSDIADMRNISKEKGAGSIVAAQFLLRFIENDTPWAHLDIAGMAWNHKEKDLAPKGATGFGVRLLNQFIDLLHK